MVEIMHINIVKVTTIEVMKVGNYISIFFTYKMAKYLKLVEIAMVQVLSSIKDETYFSNLNFIKSKFCNCLTMHLNLMIKMFIQQFYMLKNFHRHPRWL
jgi:hypothetical protein